MQHHSLFISSSVDLMNWTSSSGFLTRGGGDAFSLLFSSFSRLALTAVLADRFVMECLPCLSTRSLKGHPVGGRREGLTDGTLRDTLLAPFAHVNGVIEGAGVAATTANYLKASVSVLSMK